jgi:hypothetical protein
MAAPGSPALRSARSRPDEPFSAGRASPLMHRSSLRLSIALAASIVSLAAAGCYDSFAVLTRDGGGDATSAPIDARTAPVDARAAADAPIAPPLDGASCEGPRIAWIDETPTTIELVSQIVPRLIASPEGFEFFYQGLGPSPCDGPCPMLARVPTRGPQPTDHPAAYWAGTTRPDALFAGISAGGAPAFATLDGTELAWIIGAPSEGGGDWHTGGRADLSILIPATDGRELAAVAFVPNELRLFLGTHRSAADGRFEGFTLREMRIDEVLMPIAVREVAPFTGFPYWQATVEIDERGGIVAGLQDYDFPAAVQVGTLGVGALFAGTSCGVDAYDALPLAGDRVVVAEGCRGELRLDFRAGDLAPRIVTLATDRFAEDATPIAAIVGEGGGLVVAYWNAGGELAVMSVSGTDHGVRASAIVPGPTFYWAETFARSAALARHADGTYAVSWSLTLGGAAVQRFTIECD